jgi:hypothetical protein
MIQMFGRKKIKEIIILLLITTTTTTFVTVPYKQIIRSVFFFNVN